MNNIITITEAAAFQIKEMMKQNEEEGSFLRVAIKGGGCSGLSYGMAFEHEVGEKDQQLEQHDIKVLIAGRGCSYFKENNYRLPTIPNRRGFTIDNPNAIATCGCGSSFRTAENEGKPENC